MTQEVFDRNHYEWLHKLGLYETRYILYWWCISQPFDVKRIDAINSTKKWKKE